MKRTVLIALLLVVIAVAAASVSAPAFADRAGGGGGARCICLAVWDPVTCSNGVTYSNSCYAQCAGATGCVPGGPTQ